MRFWWYCTIIGFLGLLGGFGAMSLHAKNISTLCFFIGVIAHGLGLLDRIKNYIVK